jgi:CheY-like chemotaxis protein
VVGARKIMFVDDEPALARLVVKSLARDYDVVTVLNAEDALERLRKGERFDVFLTDLGLPGMTGDQLVEELATLDPPFAGTVGIMTGGADRRAGSGGAAASGTPCLAKPFTVGELRRFVARLLRR